MERPKVKGPSALSPKQAARVLSTKYERQFEQGAPGEENETEYATGQIERASRSVTEDMAGGVQRYHDGKRKAKAQWKSYAGQDEAPADGGTEQPEGTGHPNAPKERPITEADQNAADSSKTRRQTNSRKKTPDDKPWSDAAKLQKEKTTRQSAEIFTERQTPDASRPGRQAGSSPGTSAAKGNGTAKRPSAAKGTWQASESAPAVTWRGAMPKERPRATAATLKTRENVGAAAKVSGKADAAGTKLRRSKVAAQALSRTRRSAQRQTARQMITQARKTAKTAANLIKKAAVAVTKAAVKLITSFVGITGGGLLLIVLIMVFVISAIGNSPFGIFFAAESSTSGTVSVSEAVSTVNMAYNAKLEELQAGDYDSIETEGQAADWPEILAVFAAKTAGAEDGVDVATLDADRVQRLTDVFGDMTAITSEVETIDHPGSGEDDPGWSEHILHITVTAKTADDMRTQYGFTAYQNSALDELLAECDALDELIGRLTITNADVKAVLDALPNDLSEKRREVVETALSLVGKVNYFWGGKSSAIGWDSQWGTLQKVTAAGSTTTDTYRPYGLDCSGYVGWVLRNAGLRNDGNWYIGQNLIAVSASTALPGDFALFSDESHIGIIVGRTEGGRLLVCHCSNGHNNVVMTEYEVSGFTVIGKLALFD